MSELVIKDLSVGYIKRGRRLVVADNLNRCVRSGKLTLLIGNNGVGKSTLLRTICGLQKALAGDVQYSGKSISSLSYNERAKLVSVVLTEKLDLLHLTLRETVSLGRMPYLNFWGSLSEKDEETVSHFISLVGISALQHKKVSELSDGERQKMMIAKALTQQTPVLLLDEPTAFLDYGSKQECMALLKKLSQDEDKIILLSTHDLDIARRVADDIWEL